MTLRYETQSGCSRTATAGRKVMAGASVNEQNPIPSRGCCFGTPTPPAGRRRNPATRSTKPPPLRWAVHDKLFTGSPMLSTESLQRPVAGLTPGLDPQLPCPLRNRDRWPAQDFTQFFRGDAPLSAEHPLYLPHLLSLGHRLPFK